MCFPSLPEIQDHVICILIRNWTLKLILRFWLCTNSLLIHRRIRRSICVSIHRYIGKCRCRFVDGFVDGFVDRFVDGLVDGFVGTFLY